ncbi:hypothetical protein L596_011718 [Steinernema carpocapsae]|uniref:Uncharacterized protein n=1 Tax=Steinernema carpocapsae TaxID=34508 RepID=A0A4U5NVQ7_STECR|nr:hypothetical protein L596_011718 [Steinernema carpocapsae]
MRLSGTDDRNQRASWNGTAADRVFVAEEASDVRSGGGKVALRGSCLRSLCGSDDATGKTPPLDGRRVLFEPERDREGDRLGVSSLVFGWEMMGWMGATGVGPEKL